MIPVVSLVYEVVSMILGYFSDAAKVRIHSLMERRDDNHPVHITSLP